MNKKIHYTVPRYDHYEGILLILHRLKCNSYNYRRLHFVRHFTAKFVSLLLVCCFADVSENLSVTTFMTRNYEYRRHTCV